jgi:hypothetical protein
MQVAFRVDEQPARDVSHQIRWPLNRRDHLFGLEKELLVSFDFSLAKALCSDGCSECCKTERLWGTSLQRN